MIRLTDGTKTVEIKMATWENGNWSPDWSNDFFAVGGLPQNEDGDAYVVADVDYCIDQANDWKLGIGDFYDPEDNTDPEDRLVDVTEI